jgi:hypothetical protein
MEVKDYLMDGRKYKTGGKYQNHESQILVAVLNYENLILKRMCHVLFNEWNCTTLISWRVLSKRLINDAKVDSHAGYPVARPNCSAEGQQDNFPSSPHDKSHSASSIDQKKLQ